VVASAPKPATTTTPVAEPVIASEPTPATALKPRQTPEQYAAEREPHIVRNRAEKVRRVIVSLGEQNIDLEGFMKIPSDMLPSLAKEAGVSPMSLESWKAVVAGLYAAEPVKPVTVTPVKPVAVTPVKSVTVTPVRPVKRIYNQVKKTPTPGP